MNPTNRPYAFAFHNPARAVWYFCTDRLGGGGFGEVWRGFMSTGLSVAVKIWRPSSDPQRDLAGWQNEQALYLKCLAHPHIISSYDQFVTDQGLLLIVMELAEGSLESLVEKHGAPDPRYVLWVRLPHDDSDGQHHFTRRRAGRDFGELGSGTLPWYRSA